MAKRDSRVFPPLGIDPEHHLAQRETLGRLLTGLGRHPYGPAFVTRALDERPWQELAAELGVDANTLTKAWTRQLARVREDLLGQEDDRA